MTKTSTLDLYTRFFGLTRRPFALVPDPAFLFWSDHHQRAYSMLEYGILTRAPITLLTGEVGAGKTTLLFHLLGHVGEEVCVGLVANAQGNRGELMHWVLQSLGLAPRPEESYVQLFGRLLDHVIAEYAGGRRVVLIFDEAQNLSRESLEELRMLTNINSGPDELLQLVLVGQPELVQTVRHPSLRQFAQRVASSVHLPAMDAGMVKDYLDHRLRVAGTQEDIFSPEAASLIYRTTDGIPRLVNQLADVALVYAFTAEVRRVDAALVQRVIDEGAFFGVREPEAAPEAMPEPEAAAPPRPVRRQVPAPPRAVPNGQLPPMDARTVKAYLDHRVRVAGAKDSIFSETAAELICRTTGGLPRMVDQLADIALVYAYTYDAPQVDGALVQLVLDDGLFPGVHTPVGDEERQVLTLRQQARAQAE